MDALQYTIGFTLFFLGILVSIGLHEFGHMIPAKKFGGKVTQYFIGFGPTVWSKQIGETEYGVKAIPLGGYVKIVGMLPPGADDLADEVTYDEQGRQVTRVRKSNTGMFTQLISDARAAEWEQIGPEDADRLFYKMASWKKVVVMAGGPSVNILIAFFLFSALFWTYGNPQDLKTTNTLEEVQACIVPAEESRPGLHRRRRSASSPRRPTRSASRWVTRIVSFNGVEAESWEQVQQLIRDNGNGEADDRDRARRRAADEDDQDHGDAADHRRGRGPRAGRLPRRPADPGDDDRRPALHDRADGRHDGRRRQGARHPAGEGVRRRSGRPRARGP